MLGLYFNPIFKKNNNFIMIIMCYYFRERESGLIIYMYINSILNIHRYKFKKIS